MSNQNTTAGFSTGNNPPTVPPATGNNSGTGNNPPTAPAPTRSALTTHYEIPMLEDTDGYTHWQYCMTMVLEDGNLMGIIDGSVPKPNAAMHPDDHVDWVS